MPCGRSISTVEGPARKVTSWKTGGASIAGTSGPALGTDGTLYVALGAASSEGKSVSAGKDAAGAYANAVVALDRKTLTVKDWFTAEGADFNASPIVVRYKDKDLLAATGNDGRLYLLDGTSLGGSDHKTPLFVTPKFSKPGAGTALATWEADGTRWILATAAGGPPAALKLASNGPVVSGGVVAFKVSDQGGKAALEPGWASRDMASPLAPIVVNGMVFAAASGEFRSTGSALGRRTRATFHPRRSLRARRGYGKNACGRAAGRSRRSRVLDCRRARDRCIW